VEHYGSTHDIGGARDNWLLHGRVIRPNPLNAQRQKLFTHVAAPAQLDG
jgi:hypothetical protein